jgi:hypothetical protein
MSCQGVSSQRGQEKLNNGHVRIRYQTTTGEVIEAFVCAVVRSRVSKLAMAL